jgi:molybdate transport system substrate-binding protein
MVVYAASSMQPALQDIAQEYRSAVGDSMVFVYGSSTDLSEQIANGAPADVLLAADEQSIQRLVDRQLLIDSTRVTYAMGRLALVARCDAQSRASDSSFTCPAFSLTDLARPDIRFVAIANPAYAPYGVAARQALERAGLWASVESKLVMGANIAQAEQYVTSGNADAGIVALSLVMGQPQDSSPGTKAYTIIDAALHEPLRHVGALVSGSRHVDAGTRLLNFLRTAEGQRILARYGFAAPDSLATGSH